MQQFACTLHSSRSLWGLKMPIRMVFITLCLAALLTPTAVAQPFAPAVIAMFHGLRQQPNDLARYAYLINLLPKLQASDQGIALQMLSSIEDEPGLYNEAMRHFPLKSHVYKDLVLPTPSEWKSSDAPNIIEKLVVGRRIVLINEAHHDAHKRPEWLTLHNERFPFTISISLCKVTVPCVVDAHYVDESDDAIAADRYAFIQGDTVSKLYPRPGRYRLRA